MRDRVFLDTNVIVYAFDSSDPGKYAVARKLLEESIAAGTFVTSLQVLQEFFSVSTRKIASPLQPRDARTIIAELALHRVVEPTTIHLLRSIDTSIRRQMSYWDAMILICALDAECATLYSEDFSHGEVHEGLRIRNPFKRDTPS